MLRNWNIGDGENLNKSKALSIGFNMFSFTHSSMSTDVSSSIETLKGIGSPSAFISLINCFKGLSIKLSNQVARSVPNNKSIVTNIGMTGIDNKSVANCPI